jgi:hypothetical protein
MAKHGDGKSACMSVPRCRRHPSRRRLASASTMNTEQGLMKMKVLL